MARDAIAQLFMGCVIPEPEAERRPRIDRSMIGSPADFRHVSHIGATEAATAPSNNRAMSVMKSKTMETNGNTALHIPHFENAPPVSSVRVH